MKGTYRFTAMAVRASASAELQGLRDVFLVEERAM
jgi:hypothetical protein